MSEALAAMLVEAANLTLAVLVPVFAVAATVAVLVGLLCAALGIRDPSLAQIARALAVVLALALVSEHSAAALVDFARDSWTLTEGE